MHYILYLGRKDSAFVLAWNYYFFLTDPPCFADYKSKLVVMDEELVGHFLSSDSTKRHSRELAVNCTKEQNENVIIKLMLPYF